MKIKRISILQNTRTHGLLQYVLPDTISLLPRILSFNRHSSLRSRLSLMRIKPSVVAIHTASQLLWVNSHNHGLSPPKLWWVARSSVLTFCILLNSSSRRTKKTPVGQLCRGSEPLQVSRSRPPRPVQHLSRLKSLTCLSRSVFAVSLGTILTTPGRSLMEFTWNLALLVDSKSSSP